MSQCYILQLLHFQFTSIYDITTLRCDWATLLPYLTTEDNRCYRWSFTCACTWTSMSTSCDQTESSRRRICDMFIRDDGWLGRMWQTRTQTWWWSRWRTTFSGWSWFRWRSRSSIHGKASWFNQPTSSRRGNSLVYWTRWGAVGFKQFALEHTPNAISSD